MFKCLNFNKNHICIFIVVALFVIIFNLIVYFFPNPFVLIGDILNEYSQGIIALTAILGLLFGQSWLNTSKEKMKGKLEYDIARKYLKTVLQVRDAVKIVRNPFIPVGEMQVALEKNGFSVNDHQNKEKIDSSVYNLRWEKIQESWTNFQEILLDAEVSFGYEAVNVQKDLEGLIRKLRGVIWIFINSRESFGKANEENFKILYGTYDESDNFAKDIDKEVEKIKDFLKKHL